MHVIDFDINLDQISKIEGDAGLEVNVRNGKVTNVKFKIQEYKRFYTQGMRGKDAMVVPQFVARICGTCSNAHLLASLEAVEAGLGITVSPQTQILKRLMVNGLMIRDHALHLYVFSLPDIFEKDSLVDFDENDPKQHQYLHDALDVKAAGNNLQIYIAGRSVHAPYAAVGGFTKIPDNAKKAEIINQLKSVRPAILRLLYAFLEKIEFFGKPTVYASLRGKSEWSFLTGNIHLTDGTIIPETELNNHVEHVVIPYSHASGYTYKGKSYMTGAMARINMNKDQLHPDTLRDVEKVLTLFPTSNIYLNNVAQAIEMLHCVDDSIELLEKTTFVPEERAKPTRTDGVGVGVIEAPRGLLFYKFDIKDRKIVKGQVVIPTGQNQGNIQRDLGSYIQNNLGKDREKLEMKLEQLIRAYDPCMSCASHFLKVKWSVK